MPDDKKERDLEQDDVTNCGVDGCPICDPCYLEEEE
jgi:hypothetical protein